MPAFCIRKEKIDELKKVFSRIEGADKLDVLSRLSPEKRTAIFKNVLPDDEAALLNKSFEKAWASEKASAVIKFVRDNLDVARREKKITDAQKRSITAYIESHQVPKSKKFSEIKPIKEVLKMKQDEQLAFLKTIMSEEDAIKAQNKIGELSAGDIEKEIRERLARIGETGEKNFNAFLERKIDQISAIKAGVEMSPEEVADIVALYQDIGEAKVKMEENPTRENIMAYGEARSKYKEWAEDAQVMGKATVKESILSLIGMQRAVQLGIDFSITTIQLGGAITRKEAWSAIYSGFRNVASKKEYRDMENLVIGDPMYDTAKQSGLRVNFFETTFGKKEEAIMWNKLKERGPFKGLKIGVNEGLAFFERYTNSLSKARFEIFKDLVAKSKADGLDVSPTTRAGKKELEDIADTINDITGSSGLGIFEKFAPEANIVFLAARLMVSKFKNLVGTPLITAEHYARILAGKQTRHSNTVIKEKMRAFAGLVGISASILGLAKMSGAEVDLEPTSTNFGKIKVGNQWKDATFGYAPYIKLIAKGISGVTTSYETGISKRITKLTPEEEAAGEIRARDMDGAIIGRGDVALRFVRSKLSAVASVFTNIFTQETYMGDDVTLKGEARDKLLPLGAKDLWDTWTENDDIPTIAKIPLSILSFVGIGGYTENQRDWDENLGKELKQFKEFIGQEKFDEENEKFNKIVEERIDETVKSEAYLKMTPKDKQAEILSIKSEEKGHIFRDNGFRYKKVD